MVVVQDLAAPIALFTTFDQHVAEDEEARLIADAASDD
jgi:hypothetical protein